MMGDNSVLDIRSRQIDIKEIDKEKIKTSSLFYKSINMILPIIIFLALAFIMNWIRNRKYARKR
jgi:ABC-2 type transport system permease protein